MRPITFLDPGAFIGTNPTGELITSGLPLIRPSEIRHEADSLPKAFATALGAFNRACVRPLICRQL